MGFFHFDVESLRYQVTGIEVDLRIDIDDDTVFQKLADDACQRDTDLIRKFLDCEEIADLDFLPGSIYERLSDVIDVFLLLFPADAFLTSERVEILFFGGEERELMLDAAFGRLEVFLGRVRFAKASFG